MESVFMKAKKKAKAKKVESVVVENNAPISKEQANDIVNAVLDELTIDQLVELTKMTKAEEASTETIIEYVTKPEEPKKAVLMATKHKTKPSTEGQAFDLIYNPATRKYHLVVIEYDLDKGTSSVVSTNEFGSGNQAIVLTEMQAIFVRKVMEYSRRKVKK